MKNGLFSWWRRHLTAKITAVTLLFLTVLTAVSAWFLTHSERRVIQEQLDAAGRSLLRAASIGCIEPLLTEDYPVLDTLTQTLVHDRSDVVFVVVRRLDDTVVSQCPAQSTESLDLPPHRVYLQEIRAGDQEDDAVVGTIALGLATRITDQFLSTRSAGIAIGSLLALLQLGLVLTWTLRKVVGQPLHRLDEQAVRLGDGDLNTPVSVSSHDELGRLASTLDQMRRNLRTSYSELQEQNRQLVAVDRMKDEFLANMSHEIRTPLTAILGFADVLLETIEGDNEREAIATVKRNGDHLLQVINDILDLSKIQAGKLHVVHKKCSPHQIVADVASLMRVRASAKGLRLDVHFEGRIPTEIQTDPTRLRQILLNLVGNAIKFTDRGSVQIVGRMDPSHPDDGQLCFDVVDTGVGLNEAEISRLFEPFYQVDSSMTRHQSGTGLGLAISMRLAEKLGGSISVESDLGKGSMFSLVVSTGPLHNVEMLEDGAEVSLSRTALRDWGSNPDGAASEGNRVQATVLLAEDGPDNQRLFSYVLRRAGFVVTVAENGKVAVELAAAAQDEGTPFDLVLMDIQMPVMDGYTATRRLRQSGYSGPIIAVTAHAMSGDSEKCRQAGCDDCLTKPIDPRLFVKVVSSYVAKEELAAIAP